ncbi:MAG: Erv1/Alr family FAD-linked sulfhydryl oxidase [Candidatus Marinimicrobia bacterium]|nr:Erv1/Alr family FAD-linked sulfhydryl oxidase [Candidatus Neomarinimicrobiota bacterium]
MSPPEVWGPAVWTLFHTLTEKIDEVAYQVVSPQLFQMIVRICRFLPCPDCASDASIFLAKIKPSDVKSKTQLKELMYLFHNRVNVKKRKKLYNYGNINIYKRANLVNVVNNFTSKYQTKGNMKLIAESFQRQFVVTEFKKWIVSNIRAFYPKVPIPQQLPPPEPTNLIIQATEMIEENQPEQKQIDAPIVVEQVDTTCEIEPQTTLSETEEGKNVDAIQDNIHIIFESDSDTELSLD